MKKIKSIFMLVLLIVSGSVSGQETSQKRTFSRTFIVSDESSFELTNKYGDVKISTNDSDSLLIRAEVEAFASNEERLRKMYEGVEINISETGSVIGARTIFSQSITGLIESFKGMTNKVIPYESRIQINYYITAPVWLDMKIENRFGEVEMGDNTGTVSLTVLNGSLKVNSLNTAREMNLNFCETSIKKINDGSIDATFSGIEIEESKNLSVNSVSCKLNLKKAGRLETKSRSDKIFIDYAVSVSGDSFFSDYKIGNLSGDLNMAPKFGSLSIDLIRKEAELISINSGSADLNLEFEQGMSYRVEIRHTNSNLVLPRKDTDFKKEALDDDRNEYLTTGFVGNKRGNTQVKIEATRGNIYLR